MLQTLLLFLAILAADPNAKATVFDFDAVSHLGPEFEVPPVAGVDAHGSAGLSYNAATGELSWEIEYVGMTATPTSGHIHGPALEHEVNGVLLDLLGNSSSATSPIIGSAVIPVETAESIVIGETYINLHTPSNGGGEIRGQIYAAVESGRLEGSLDTDQEVGIVTGAESATGVVVMDFDPELNTLNWLIRFQDMSGPLTGGHIHAPAEPGVNASVKLDLLANSSGSTSPIRGSIPDPDPSLLGYFFAERAYVNLHTSTNSAGELRAQIASIVYLDGFE